MKIITYKKHPNIRIRFLPYISELYPHRMAPITNPILNTLPKIMSSVYERDHSVYRIEFNNIKYISSDPSKKSIKLTIEKVMI